jgi:hypothetical protein
MPVVHEVVLASFYHYFRYILGNGRAIENPTLLG